MIEEAHRSHPFVRRGGASCECSTYRGLQASGAPFDAPLPEPASEPAELWVEWSPLRHLRKLVSSRATAAGLRPERAADIVLAVHEVAANSLRHGGGAGTLPSCSSGLSSVGLTRFVCLPVANAVRGPRLAVTPGCEASGSARRRSPARGRPS